MSELDIFLPLQGPDGVRAKAPATGAWQSPGYTGLTEQQAKDRFRVNGEWFGLRTDEYVVIDCDAMEAAEFWLGHADADTWIRKSPRGYHFIYARYSNEDPDGPSVGVWPHIDIRAGRTSQIVFFAPGYYELNPRTSLRTFDRRWLPEDFGQRSELESWTEWDEMPDGVGNNTMTAIAGTMRRQGMSLITMARCLGAINKITMPSNPMSTDEIILIAKSVARYDAHPDVDIEVDDE